MGGCRPVGVQREGYSYLYGQLTTLQSSTLSHSPSVEFVVGTVSLLGTSRRHMGTVLARLDSSARHTIGGHIRLVGGLRVRVAVRAHLRRRILCPTCGGTNNGRRRIVCCRTGRRRHAISSLILPSLGIASPSAPRFTNQIGIIGRLLRRRVRRRRARVFPRTGGLLNGTTLRRLKRRVRTLGTRCGGRVATTGVTT